ncbi:radical SAM protein [Sulfitobacter donghicola]|uniref:radical SAM protein n=1 Tax=Sulfitobacter donghicola TaxID=421000 RepID=UPI00138E3436|nr:radical SAM protein [Sulfitobacter donghicola]
MKLSKFCNLRCSYCYEWDGLGDPARLDLEKLSRFLDVFIKNVGMPGDCHNFIWHGGEPLVLPFSYLTEFIRIQNDLKVGFSQRELSFSNAIQTNLVSVKPKHIEFLQENDFLVGVSFDAVSGVRVDCAGKETESRVARNMELLRKQGLRFGAITVVGAHNVSRLKDIYRFYKEINCAVRFLPIYRDHLDSRYHHDRASIHDVFDALFGLFKVWVLDRDRISVHPFSSWLEVALGFLSGDKLPIKGKSRITIIDTSAKVYKIRSAYAESEELGELGISVSDDLELAKKTENLVQEPLGSPCADCRFRDYCLGQFVDTARPEMGPYCGVDYLAIEAAVKWIMEDGNLTDAAIQVFNGSRGTSDGETRLEIDGAGFVV